MTEDRETNFTKRMQAAGKSISDLAQELHVKEVTIWRYSQKRENPNKKMLKAIAKCLRCEPRDLM